jgi:YD repeat-containing protein
MITKNILFSALVSAITVLHFGAYAQGDELIKKLTPKPVPASPNVASLGKFGDYPVSHFTGVPDISIPIFEVKSGSLQVPITLSYHASGIKPTDVASWVGMGWSLSTGGQVSRSVNGKPDENYYTSHALNSNPSVCGTYYYLNDNLNFNDSEPDVFSYAIPGRSGKFMLPYNSPAYLIPAAPLVITPQGIDKFDLTDEHGIFYRFGSYTPYAVEATNATNGGNPQLNASTAWHLTEINAPNSNDKISYTYQSVGTSHTHDIAYAYVLFDQCYQSNGGVCPSNTFVSTPKNIDSSVNQNAPETITFEGGKVKFILSSTNRLDIPDIIKSLDRIEIYSTVNGVDQLVKTVKFIYSYYSNGAGPNAALKLDAVEFRTPDNTPIQKYTLGYSSNSLPWNPSASGNNYLNARDLWGYYNGATGNADLILPKSTAYQVGGSTFYTTVGAAYDRTVNETLMKQGVLNRIDFPTGGYTTFDYEANRYLNTAVSPAVATKTGGLRIRQIISTDGISAPPVVKTYKYGIDEAGNGVANFLENMFNYSATQLYFSDCDITSPITTYQIRVFASNSSFSGDPFDSSPILYPYVTEYFGDPAGQTNGKIKYVYDNGSPYLDMPQVVMSSTKHYENSFAWMRGKLTSKAVFDKNNNQVASSQFSYSTLQNVSNRHVGWGIHQFVTGNGACGGNTCRNEVNDLVHSQTFMFSAFYQSTGVLIQDTQSETTYENGNINKFLTTGSSTNYDNATLQPLQTSVIRNNGDQYVTINRYPFQLSANSSSTGAAKAIYSLNSKHVLSLPIEKYTYDGAKQTVVSAQLTTYRQSEANPNYVVPDQIYLGEFAANYAVSSYVPAVINGSNNGLTMNSSLKPRINMINYSSEGEILAVSKVNDAPVSYQYGYNKALPVAEVKNATNTKYSYQTYSTGSKSVNISSPNSTSQTVTDQFTVGTQGGPVTLKLGVLTNLSYNVTAYYSFSPTMGSIASGSMALAKGDCALTQATFSNVAPGTYTYSIYFVAAGAGATVCGNFDYPASQSTTAGITEFSYENFEEGSVTTSPLTAHTGKGYVTSYIPTFTIPTTNPMRNYTIEYWYWNGSAWVYTSKPYTGTGTVVNEGSAYDNVRIYPTDARMKSYTYDPILGITSVIDENGSVMYYDYDSFGRLARIRNDKGGVEKQYTYHYKGQQ